MAEWHLTPTYILYEITEELLGLMFEKRNERIRAMTQESEPQKEREPKRISADEFFANMKQTVNSVNVGSA